MSKNTIISGILVLLLYLVVVVEGYANTSSINIDLTAQEQATSIYLDDIRDYTPELIMFMNKFPKGADIHNHLTGAFFIDEILVYAAENNYLYDLTEYKILPHNSAKNSHVITVAELLQRNKDLVDFLNVVSMRGFYKNTMHGSDHFFETFSHIPDNILGPEHFARVIARNHGQSVYYLELMKDVVTDDIFAKVKNYLPASSFNENDLETAYKSISAFLHSENFSNTVNKAMKNRITSIDQVLREQYKITILGDTPDMMLKFIPHLYRHEDNYGFFVRAAINLMATKVHKNIVAINMVQCESHPLALQNFDKQIEILDFLYKKLDKPNILLHAGELNLRDASLESMRERISQSIIKGHALRIGHGTSIAWEKDPQKTMNIMKENGIAVEICLSSSDDILGIAGNDHPLRLYLKAGVPVTLNTDDEGVSRSNLSNEYVRAAQEHELSYATLKEISQNALEYSLLTGDSIYEQRNNDFRQEYILKDKYKQYIDGKLKGQKLSIKELGEKAYFQIKHERDLENFENQYSNQ